jgi:signal peptidase I
VARLTAGLFPVIIVVFLLRPLVRASKIPSGSMILTLLINDLIFANKFHYGVRLPVITPRSSTTPHSADVMVFRYPPKPSLTTSSVVGVPGTRCPYPEQKKSRST